MSTSPSDEEKDMSVKMFSMSLAIVVAAVGWLAMSETHDPGNPGMEPAETQQAAEPSREAIVEAAQDIMVAVGPGALITIGADGSPQARVMDAFPPEPDLTVWMGTNRGTRKVTEIRADPRVTLIYFDAANPGYVTLIGTARLVDDAAEKRARFKDAWADYYLGGPEDEDYLLIEIVPRRLEVVSVKHAIASDPLAWKPAIIELQ